MLIELLFKEHIWSELIQIEEKLNTGRVSNPRLPDALYRCATSATPPNFLRAYVVSSILVRQTPGWLVSYTSLVRLNGII